MMATSMMMMMMMMTVMMMTVMTMMMMMMTMMMAIGPSFSLSILPPTRAHLKLPVYNNYNMCDGCFCQYCQWQCHYYLSILPVRY